jgi:competence protein ComEC
MQVGRGRGVSDLGAVLVAAGALLGALCPTGVPVAVGVAVVGVAVLLGRSAVLVVAVAVLASGLSHQAWAGLSPLPPGPFAGTVVLVGDPEPAFGGWRVDVRTSVGRLELSARGGAGGRLGSRHAGARVTVTGRIEQLPEPARAASRHVRGRLVAETVQPVDDGAPWAQAVDGIRSLVVDGAEVLPAEQRPLFTGFVLGDDRGMPTAVADDFDGAGLAHLLVVSGQNVAFVVAVAAPLLGRLRHRSRFVTTIVLLVTFAAVTRFEPSVLRATAMAATAAVATALGRPVGAVRVLALAVTGLVLVDPLLVTSLGFRLSTAATLGIVVLARPLASALPGPRPVALVAAVTLSAQVAVAPLLVPTFGPLPVASLPANVLAEPVAGLVMMWGCTAGLVAGMVPTPLAWVLHLPTRAGLWWVSSVARMGAAAPLGRVGLIAVAATAAALLAAVLVARRRPRLGRALAGVVLVALLVIPRPPSGTTAVADLDVGGARLSRTAGAGTAVLVVPGNARADDVLAELRDLGVGSLDLVVLRSAGPTAAGVLHTVRQRVEVDAVWAPALSPAEGAVAPPAGPVSAGGLTVTARPVGDGLEVDVDVRSEATRRVSP